TAVVKFGGSGRPVVGKFKIQNTDPQIEWGRTGDFYFFTTEPPKPSGFKTEEDYKAWRTRPEIQRVLDELRVRPVQCAKDGSFRIDQVDSGQYVLRVVIRDPRDSLQFPRFIARYEGAFDIPASQPNTREPLDLGVIEIPLIPRVAVKNTN